MPLDKNMSHEEMVKELMASYEKNGKIGSTKPRDEKHALEIANAVAYNIEESNEVKEIDRKVKEMTLDEMLNKWEEFLSAKEKELGISEVEENPKVKVTLDSGETFETEVDPATSEDELEQQYKTGTEINVGKEGQERKARIKSATLTKQMGEELELDEKFFNESKFVVYSPSEEREENLSPEDRSVFDSNGIRNIMISYLRGKTDKEVIRTFRTLIDKMPDEWVAEFLRNQDDTVVEPVNEDLENPPAVIENPTDVVSLDIPLLMRLLEWSREQAGEDVDLHVLTENLVEAMKDTEFLTMDDYERLVPCEECNDEEELKECDGSCATTSSDLGVDQILPFGKKSKVKDLKKGKFYRSVKNSTPRH